MNVVLGQACVGPQGVRAPKLAASSLSSQAGSSQPGPASFSGRSAPVWCSRQSLRPQQLRWHHTARATESEGETKEKTPFGYSRKDILLIGGGVFGLGLAGYYGLQATGMEAGMAGNFVQFTIFVFFCIGWISSYLFRVLNKDMTYTKQLDAYENAVMNKRLEEMPEAERERLYAEIEEERERRRLKQQQQQ